MLNIEIKHDTQHNKWHRLSVRLLDAMGEHRNRAKLALTAVQYMEQYAIDHQMNHDQLSVRVVDGNEITIFYRRSSAQINSGKATDGPDTLLVI
jgi:hypothetical protein